MNKTIVIGGAVAQKPGFGGHTWQFLQYLLGFKSLGWDVLLLDQLQPEMCIDATGKKCDVEKSENLRYFFAVMQGFGLNGSLALIYGKGQRYFGLSKSQVLERLKHSAFLLNVMGFINDEEILQHAPHRVFLDTDPGFGQMWCALGLTNLFKHHDDYVTIGENIGQPDCAIPTCEMKWITTPQPVALDYWPLQTEVDNGWITSIASWRGAYGPVEYQGKIYGLRVHEFRKFMELPRRSGKPFELALQIHPDEKVDLERLAANQWSLIDPQQAAGDPWIYQRYIQRCKAEFMVAKNMYVQSNSGWFSDRSICFLASGKPVLAQDTGFTRLYPASEGLLAFSTMDQALGCIENLYQNYDRHVRAAREIAEEYFDAKKVLGKLLGMLGVS